MSLFNELKRRNVFRVAAAYLVAGWLLVEVFSVILDVYLAPSWVMQVFVALLVVGFPVVLLFSWVYELTPEGVKRETDIERDDSITHRTGRRLDLVTIVLLVLAVGFVAFERVRPVAPPASADHPAALPTDPIETESVDSDLPSTPSIAVLPFADLSPQGDQAYFSDGISEELLNLLAKVPDLKVAARTSSFRFKGEQRDIGEIAGLLGVNHVLEGSVRKAGDRVRVTAQLIDARDGFHLWSESFDEQLTDILLVQDRIAGQIVDALSRKLGLAIQAPEVSQPELTAGAAYDHYLRANYTKHLRTPESLLESVASYQQAVTLDPGMAAAWGGLSRAAVLSSEFYPTRTEEFEALAQKAWEMALTIVPDEPRALGARAGWRFFKLDFAGAFEDYDRSIASDPADTEAMAWLAQRYRLVGFLDRAEALNRRAYAMDPLSPRVILGLTRTLAMTGQGVEARRVAEQAMRQLDGHWYALRSLLEVQIMTGELDGADERLEQLRQHHPYWYLEFALRLAAARGDESGIRAIHARLVSELDDHPSGRAWLNTMTDYFLGDMDSALALLDQIIDDGFDGIEFLMAPATRARMPESARRTEPYLTPWIERYPDVVAAYAGIGVDILAELEASEPAQ